MSMKDLACLKEEELPQRADNQSMNELVNAEHHRSIQGFMNTDDIVYGYLGQRFIYGRSLER